MATSVTSYVETYDDKNAPSPQYFTAPNTYQMLSLFGAGNSQFFRNEFNQPVKMGDNETEASSMFSGFRNMNSEVIIGNNVTNCFGMFSQCINYNQPVVVPNNVTNCGQMFAYASNFNSNVVISSGVTNCNMMFFNCTNFNKPIIIPDNVTDCSGMFVNCTSMNSNVVIGNNVTNCDNMFRATGTYTPNMSMRVNDLYIPGNVKTGRYMFASGNNRPKNIYINSVGISDTGRNFLGMVMQTEAGGRTNIYCNHISLINSPYSSQSVTGYDMTYSAITNGYYNQSYNLYLYFNYTG